MITLSGNSKEILYLSSKDKHLAQVISSIGPISYAPHKDGYAFLVHEIIEQMLSVKAGAKIYARLKVLCGGRITIKAVGKLSAKQIKSIGTSKAKVGYIQALTKALKTKELGLPSLRKLDDDDVIKALTSIRGLGIWSAKMYLIFVLNRNDVLPYEDAAFLQSYEWLYKTKDRSKEAVKKKCKKWKPYSSIAARYLYRALDEGLTKEEFHLVRQRRSYQMTREERSWHPAFIKYMNFIIHHPNYKGLKIEKKADGSYKWLAPAESEVGQQRIEWCKKKARELGIPIRPGVYADVMLAIHPTKKKICQTCGKEMSLYYHYPNRQFLKTLNKVFNSSFTECDHISYIYDALIAMGVNKKDIATFLIAKGDLSIDPIAASKEEIIDSLEFACRKGGKKCLGPGAMSNFPDRFDGFHSYNRCCRSSQDKGRSKENLKSYAQDRRAYEYWSDGNIHAANQFMGSQFFSNISADHIGPISLGFIHDSRFLQPMKSNDNSSKRDRLQLSDIKKIIAIEDLTHIDSMSWYSKKIWKFIKAHYLSNKDKIKGQYRDALKQNMSNYMFILWSIMEKCKSKGQNFLVKALLSPNFHYFEYSYEFNEHGEIVATSPRHITGRNRDEINRYVRIALSSVYDYHKKENRQRPQALTKGEQISLENLCQDINSNRSTSSVKTKLIALMISIQDRIVNSL